MARWTGHPEITKILPAAEAWRDRCLLANGSIFSKQELWTVSNLTAILERFENNPIVGSSRDFLDKLHEQLTGASAAVIQVAAEVIWFLFLFPSSDMMKPETKRSAVVTVWGWSGQALPANDFMDDATLGGVGNAGTAYLTHRPSEFAYLLRTLISFKSLPAQEQRRLLQPDSPWEFGAWLDAQEGSDRRLVRNVFLYFLFPDFFERNTSRAHRRQIYESFKDKIPADKRIRGREKTLLDYDRAIYEIRNAFQQERGTTEFDFYKDDVKGLWFSGLRDGKRKDFMSWLDTYLTDRGLRLNQSGRDTTMEKLASTEAISAETGFWSDDSGLTAKPPRWLLHVDLTGPKLKVVVPSRHRSRAIGFANTKGGDSGALAVRILVLAKTADNSFQPIGAWEWLLLFCFPGGLKPGSAAQTFDDFDPETGVLTYMGDKIPYIYSALLCLNEADEAYSANVAGTKKTITYREVTDALTTLIHVTDTGAQND